MINEPLKFKPILKEKIWGGKKLNELLNKKSNKNNVGESWEISNVEGNVSIVSEGAYKGKSLSEVIKKYKSKLVGYKVYKKFGDKFPLLIKFIDANFFLSIQLHPNDKLAKKKHRETNANEAFLSRSATLQNHSIIYPGRGNV